MNFYVRLYKQHEFQGQPASVVATQAGKQWSKMSEKEKECYYKMAEKARKPRKSKLGMRRKGGKDAVKRKEKNYLSAVSDDRKEKHVDFVSQASSAKDIICSQGSTDDSCFFTDNWVHHDSCSSFQTPLKEAPCRPPTPRPGYNLRPGSSNIYEISTLKKSKSTADRKNNNSTEKNLSFDSDDMEEVARPVATLNTSKSTADRKKNRSAKRKLSFDNDNVEEVARPVATLKKSKRTADRKKNHSTKRKLSFDSDDIGGEAKKMKTDRLEKRDKEKGRKKEC